MLRPRSNFREAELWFYMLPSRKWIKGRIFTSFKDLKTMLVGRQKIRSRTPFNRTPILVVYKHKS